MIIQFLDKKSDVQGQEDEFESNRRTVKLRKDKYNSFGFSADANNIISKIDDEGPAKKNGELDVGDRIHSINGEIVTNDKLASQLLYGCDEEAEIIITKRKPQIGGPPTKKEGRQKVRCLI